MREIKFRQPVTLRSGEFHCWHYWGYIGNNLSFFTSPLTSNDGEIKKSYQSTGLNDKNGNEIYEGDVFGKFGGDKDRPEEYEYHGKVYFDEDLLAFCVAESNGGWTYLNEYERPEIIGNIYENPELSK